MASICRISVSLILLWFCLAQAVRAEDGHELWLRYPEITETALRDQYRRQLTGIVMPGESKTIAAARAELSHGLKGLLGQDVPTVDAIKDRGIVVAGTPRTSPAIEGLGWEEKLQKLGSEGYLIQNARFAGQPCIVIAAREEIGVLYGAFHLLRLVQTRQPIDRLVVASAPRIQRRMLNHWDTPGSNQDSVEWYKGHSVWRWNDLPEKIDARYVDYARACASVGINGMTPNNVNAKVISLTPEYLRKTAALADVFRPYGVRVYLSLRFSAPKEMGATESSDPLDPQVAAWWKAKADEIYGLIPDFGGFLVKANSEGQPGPQDYGRTHADGANMLARAVAPHAGIVIWRAFVYGGGKKLDPDRVKQSAEAFLPLDGKFDKNVFVQVKNGPLDFQPCEPPHPLFGRMPRTPLMMEFEINQEYTGKSTFLAYLAPMWKEVFDFDTFGRGNGSTVARVVDGSLEGHSMSGIAGVANSGSARNWCGHHFAQANWYCFGRQAWDPSLEPKAIAEEWTRMTLSNEKPVVETIVEMMIGSWAGLVDTMTPLGLNVLHAGDHYSPAPEKRSPFHKADGKGLGYDRTRAGSGGVDQYLPPRSDLFNNPATCPEQYLLWFHHVAWDTKMKSGRTLWEELCQRYERGAANATKMRRMWEGLRGKIDAQRFREVAEKLKTQEKDALGWRDTCLNYFQQFSRMPIPGK